MIIYCRQTTVLLSLIIAAAAALAGPAGTRTPLDDYRAHRNAIDRSDPDKILELANWAREKYPKDILVMKRVRADLETALELKKQRKEDYLAIELALAQVSAGSNPPPPPPPPPPGQKDLLIMRDIYMIRLRELAPNDRVGVVFKNDVIGRYAKLMRGREVDGWDRPGKEKAFRKMPAIRQALEILRHQEDNVELLEDIHVETDPMFFKIYQKVIWPQIRNRCAAPRCHGGNREGKGPRFVVDSRTDSPEGRYTNFAILSGYLTGRDGRIIDRRQPKMSLLLQYGLDRRVGRLRHKKEIKPPLFKSTDDQLYKRICAWIKALKGPLHPDYDIDRKKLNGVEVELRGKRKIIIRGLE